MTELFAPNCWMLYFAGILVPEFRRPASDAELAFDEERLTVRISDEIAFSAVHASVDVAQRMTGNVRERLEIGFNANLVKDLCQRFAPDDFQPVTHITGHPLRYIHRSM